LPAGYRVVIRTAETLLPFNVPQRAASTRLTVGQVLTASGIEVTVQGTAPVREICTVLPQGRVADMSASQTRASHRVHQIGLDTVRCADVASPLPARVSFAMSR
jgi:hypothetical protein